MKIGRVYKIVHNQSDLVYIGSTFNQLRFRFQQHKTKGNCIISKYLKEYGKENFKIILIKKYNVIDREHLHAKEQLWINKLRCINKNNCIAFLWKDIYFLKYNKKYYYENKEYFKEYREENKEHIKIQFKKYYQENKEYNKERHKKYYQENKERLKIKYYQNKQLIAQKNRQKIYCEICNCIITKSALYHHRKSKKHIKNLTTKTTPHQ